MSLGLPANIGKRLLPSIVDELALSDPDRVLYSVARTKNPADGFRDISAKTFARAVNSCSWYIEKSLGRGQNFPTLAYIGPQDLVYIILVLACVKTGYKLLLNSPRNTLEAHLSLFEKTDCNIFLFPLNFPLPIIGQILAMKQMRVLEIPGMLHWFGEGPEEQQQVYPYTKTFAEARLEPLVVLHTSGSTGMPKPVVQVHGTCSPLDAFSALHSLGQQPTTSALCAGKRMYVSVPLFHTAGLGVLLGGTIYGGITSVIGPFPPSADIANSIHIHGKVQQSLLVPTTMVELAKNPEYLENLGRLELVIFGGGPCPQEVGDRISARVRLLNVLGSTEAGSLPVHLCDPEDWAYMRVSPMLGHEYRQVSEELYEHVIVRDPKLELYQGVFATFPELQEWPMRDLYSKHPTKEDLWLYRGRVDDIIVFATGEKLNPLEVEGMICATPLVKGALVAGLARFQSSLLVEAVTPPTNEAEKKELLDAIWPTVQAANKESPSHGRIHRNMIIFTSADKPMLRAGKGTVQRRVTLDLYAAELDALYQAADELMDGQVDEPADGQDSVEQAVKNIITTSTDVDIEGLARDADLFERGLDSLQVILMTRELNKLLLSHERPQGVEARSIYANPSIEALVKVVSGHVEGKSPTHNVKSDEKKMQSLYDLYAADMPLSVRKAQPKPSDGLVVLLTGSTGSLGSYILDSLVNDARVSRIYCLIRGPGGSQRQQKSLAAKGLKPLSDKVQCLDADLSSPYFGLPTSKYKTILTEVTDVIHNAWRVDFNLSIESFSSHLGVVRRFAEFSAHSHFDVQIFFISSISAVGNWSAVTGRSDVVPEQVYEDWRIPETMGYGQSKFIAERLLDAAAKEADIRTVICRVGQIAGPTTAAGLWPKKEWLPSLVASSKALGKLPASIGQMDAVDWIPVDVLGRGIVELMANSTSTPTSGATVYHAVNPQQTTWTKLLRVVARYLSAQGGEIKIVQPKEWVDAVRESASSKDLDLAINPAVKLLGFFEELVGKNADWVRLDTRNAVDASQTLQNLGPIRDQWMENWLRQWGF